MNGKSDWFLKLLENSVEFLVVYLFLKFPTNPVEKVTQLFVVIPVENFPGRNRIPEKVFLFFPSEWPQSKFLSYLF